MHHAAGDRAGLVDLHGMAHQRQMMRARQAARAGADDQDAFAGGRRGDRRRPLLGERLVSEKTLDRVDRDRRVELAAVAVGLARVIADAAVHRRQRIVLDDRLPRLAETAGGGMREPGLDVLAGGTGVVAGREEVEIDRPLRAHVADRPRGAEVRRTGQIGGLTARTGGLFTHRARPPLIGLSSRRFGRSRVAWDGGVTALAAADAAARAPALMRNLPRHYRLKPMRKRIPASKLSMPHGAHVRLAFVRPMRAYDRPRKAITLPRRIEAPKRGHHTADPGGKQGRLRRDLPCADCIAGGSKPYRAGASGATFGRNVEARQPPRLRRGAGRRDVE